MTISFRQLAAILLTSVLLFGGGAAFAFKNVGTNYEETGGKNPGSPNELARKKQDEKSTDNNAPEAKSRDTVSEKTKINPIKTMSDCDSYAPLAEQLMPAVVSITATKKQKSKRSQATSAFPFKDLRDLMENLQPYLDQRGQPNSRNVFLFGSGFIIDPSGIIVTNNHVIENTEDITVRFNDDTTAQARVLGRDPLTDIAVLKVEARHLLPYVSFGNSDGARIGDRVLAIGSPIGLGGSVSAGIISARSRDIHAGPYDEFLQTDTPLNQGSSGSPLFNMKGEVIGINTAIYSTSGGGNIGIGFSIPSNSAISIVNILKTKSKVRRGYFGITVQEVTPEIAQSLGHDDWKGVLVSTVVKDSPADNGGLKVGDVIMEFDGKPVVKVREFSKMVAYSTIGKKTSVKILRNDEPKILSVKVGELNVDKQDSAEDGSQQSQEDKGDVTSILGLKVRSITSEVRRDQGLAEGITGVLVISVDSGSEAESSGIKKHDVITNLVIARGARVDVVNIESFKGAVQAAFEQKQKSVLIQVMRAGHVIFIPVPLDGKK